MILPYIDQAPLYTLVAQAINENRMSYSDAGPPSSADTTAPFLLDTRRLPAFLCPSDTSPQTYLAWNNYGMCMGANKGWVGTANQNGMFNRQVYVDVAAVQDGMSNTIAASELIIAPNGGTAGTQSDLARMRYGASLNANNAPDVVFALPPAAAITKANVDAWGQAALALTNISTLKIGGPWYLGQPNATAFNTLLTPNSRWPNTSFSCDGCASDTKGLQGARSRHTGGVHTLMGDGTVKFVSENIDWTIWNAIGGRNDGTTVGDF